MRAALRRPASAIAVAALLAPCSVSAIAVAAALLAPSVSSAFPLPAISLQGGLSSTDLEPTPYAETHRILGGTGGVALDIHFNDRFSIEPEVLLVRRGARLADGELKDSGGNSLGVFHTFVTADYVDVPVLGRFEPPTGLGFKPFAILGPRLGFKTAERLTMRGSLSQTLDSSVFENFELGATVGGGVEYGLGPHRVVLDLRYDAGFTRHDDGVGGRFRTDAVLLMAGYVFHPGP